VAICLAPTVWCNSVTIRVFAADERLGNRHFEDGSIRGIEMMVQEGEIEDLILRTVRHLVDTPAAVTIGTITDVKGTTYQVRVAKADVGQVIGKDGRTAQSIRTILGAIATKNKRKFLLEIVSTSDRS
jgi:hypothetical protein